MKLFLIILILSVSSALYSQKIHHMRTEFNKNKYTIRYDIAGPEGQACMVRLYTSTDGGANFDREITDATGDIGEKVKVGQGKKIIWDASNEKLDSATVKFSLQVIATGMPPKKKKK